MMRRFLAALALWPSLAVAADLPTIAPTPPAATSNNQIATTAWVNLWAASAMPLAAGKIWIGSAGGIATPQTPTGDLSMSNAGVFTFGTVNANVGSFGSATQCGTFTVNAKGLITAASQATCTPAIGSVTGLGTGVATALGVAANGSGGFIGPTPTRAGDVAYWNGSAWTTLAGNNSGTNCFSENASGVPSWAACSGGGGGSPGGSTTQVQYNNAGAFGGITGATTNGTTLTLVAPILGTPASATLTNATGLPISTGVSGLGTGIATALGVNVGTAGSPVVNGGVLGTPSSGTLTNATGLPIATGVSGLGTGCATFLGTPSSANLRGCLTDEVGTGAAYFVGGALGTPASGTATNLTGLPISTGLTGAGTGVLTALGVNVGSAGAPVINGGVLGTPSSGTLTNATGLPVSTGVSGLGTGIATALGVNVGTAGSPVINGGVLGTPSSGTATNLTGLPISTGVSGLGAGVATALGNATNAAGGVVTSPVANANLANSATTVAGSTCTLGSTCGLTSVTNSLGADVALNSATYTDGPSVSNGTSGTWFASGTVTISDTGGAPLVKCKLWDGTTVMASASVGGFGAANVNDPVPISGLITTPAANIRISCISNASATAKMIFNFSGLSKDSTLSAVRIN